MVLRIEFGIKTGTEDKHHKTAIKHLRPVLKQWGLSIEGYCKNVWKDAPYYYNERANLSLLAAAAWQAGTVALEEYHTEKKSGRGRTDLFLQMGGRDGIQIEAKQAWMPAHLKDLAFRNRIERVMQSAYKSADLNTESDARAACTFFVPLFSLAKTKKYVAATEKCISEQLRRFTVLNADQAHLWAWCFPECNRRFKDREKGVDYYYPGVVLALGFGRHFRWRS